MSDWTRSQLEIMAQPPPGSELERLQAERDEARDLLGRFVHLYTYCSVETGSIVGYARERSPERADLIAAVLAYLDGASGKPGREP